MPREGGGGARQARRGARGPGSPAPPAGSARRSAALAGVHGPVALAVQVEGPGAQEVSARKGHAVVAFVGIFEARLGVHGRVGQRCRLGLAAVGIVVQPEVAGGQDARVAVGEVDGQGLALGDVAQHLPVGGSDAEAVRTPLLHVKKHHPAVHARVAGVPARGHVPGHAAHARPLGGGPAQLRDPSVHDVCHAPELVASQSEKARASMSCWCRL